MASNNKVFEYAVIRIVPIVEREEFINVGVVLLCKELDYISAKIELNTNKILAMCPQSNIDSIQANLNAFENIAAGLTTGGPIAEYIPVERFRWLTATRSTIVQCSKIHPGFCTNPELKLNQLFSDYVELKEM